DTRNPIFYLLSSLSLVGGMLTYDIYHPIAAVVGLYLLVAIVRNHQQWRRLAVGLALFALPILLTLPYVMYGLEVRRDNYTGFMKNSGVDFPPSSDAMGAFASFLGTNLGDLMGSLFVRQRWGDFLLNREGPLVNAALLPLLVI